MCVDHIIFNIILVILLDIWAIRFWLVIGLLVFLALFSVLFINSFIKFISFIYIFTMKTTSNVCFFMAIGKSFIFSFVLCFYFIISHVWFFVFFYVFVFVFVTFLEYFGFVFLCFCHIFRKTFLAQKYFVVFLLFLFFRLVYTVSTRACVYGRSHKGQQFLTTVRHIANP